jgi:hypothetical protein
MSGIAMNSTRFDLNTFGFDDTGRASKRQAS